MRVRTPCIGRLTDMYLTRVLLTCYSTAGGPAFQAGLKKGDRILSVNGKALKWPKQNPWGETVVLKSGVLVQEALSTSDNPGDKVHFPILSTMM